jgi:hypothetical protein
LAETDQDDGFGRIRKNHTFDGAFVGSAEGSRAVKVPITEPSGIVVRQPPIA